MSNFCREFVSGIIVTSQLEQMSLTHASLSARGIVTSLSSTYHKKARGTITAKCTPPALPSTEGKHEYKVCFEAVLEASIQHVMVAVLGFNRAVRCPRSARSHHRGLLAHPCEDQDVEASLMLTNTACQDGIGETTPFV
jgi:hypothetical protein